MTVNVVCPTLNSVELLTSSNTVQVGQSLSYSIWASFFIGNKNITNQAVISSDSPGIVTAENGMISGVSDGSAIISVSFGGKSSSSLMTAESASLVALYFQKIRMNFSLIRQHQ